MNHQYSLAGYFSFSFSEMSFDVLAERLSVWQGTLPSRRLDLISELGDSKSFALISGEALVVHACRDLMKNWQNNQCSLPAVFYIDRLLELVIKRREGTVVVVWLDGLADLLTGAERAIREIVKSRLDQRVLSKTFSSWVSVEFTTYLSSIPVAFFLVSDTLLSEQAHPLVERAFQAFSLALISTGFRVAFLYGIEPRGKRLVAFTVGAEFGDSDLNVAVGKVFAEGMESNEVIENEELVELKSKIGSIAAVISIAIRSVLSEDNSDEKMWISKLLIASLVVAESLKLESRAFATLEGDDWPEVFGPEGWVNEIIEEVLIAAAELMRSNFQVASDCADLFDMRLVRTLAFFSYEGENIVKSLDFSESGKSRFQQIWSVASSTDAFILPKIAIRSPRVKALPSPPIAPSNPSLVELDPEVTSSVYGYVSGTGTVTALEGISKESGERSEFYCEQDTPQTSSIDPLALLLDYHREKDEINEAKYDRFKNMSAEKRAWKMKIMEAKWKQRQQHSLHLYAKSLSGHDKLHYPIVVDEGKKESAKLEKSAESGKPKISSKAAQIIEKNMAKAAEKQTNKDEDQMKPLLEKAEKISEFTSFATLEAGLLDFLSGLGRVLDSFDGFGGIASAVKTKSAQAKVILAAIKSIKSSLKLLGRTVADSPQTEAAGRQLTGRILRLSATFVRDFAEEIDGRGIQRIQDLLLSVGLVEMSGNLFSEWERRNLSVSYTEKGEKIEKLSDDSKEVKEVAKSKKTKDSKETKSGSLSGSEFYLKPRKVEVLMSLAGSDEFLFQLFFLGSDMDRPIGTKPDDRVMFKPDLWQRNLLDIVDARESALVCAPTASGKTFICYYAIEQVLRSDNESIAVYVAPSKALLNQVEAEIYVRFSSKKYPANSSMELCGTLSQDFSKNVANCQVLVTLPNMLEQLFMSPTYNAVARRIRYVVLDEVHCIGESESSLSWEHSIQLLPCPFLALSATVGNPQTFHSWLNETAKRRGNPKVHLIEYKERFNDIQKNMYSSDCGIYPLHPYAGLSYREAKGGIPADLVMTPPEAALWFMYLKEVLPENSLRWLTPSEYFAGCQSVITKRQFRFYERTLWKVTCGLLESAELSEKQFEQIHAKLLLSRRIGDAESLNALWKELSKTGSVKKSSQIVSGLANDAVSTIPKEARYNDPSELSKMLRKLESVGLLPTIVFNFDRGEINSMVESLTSLLQTRQWKKYHGTEERSYRTKQENKKRKDAYEALLERRELMLKKKRSEEDFDETEVADDLPAPPVMVEDEFDADFSFAGIRAMGDPDVEEMINKLRGPKVKDIYIEALRRGIGMHHEGCNTRYRRTVEILFRRGFLRVVIATGTLALGINMPCKSTVFAGASVELNGLMFKQMSGRAGRRGFDLIGHVVFTDASFHDISRIIAADVTSLYGDFSLTVTTVLRLVQLRDELKSLSNSNQLAAIGFSKNQQTLLNQQIESQREYLERAEISAVFSGFLSKNMEISTDQTAILYRFNVDFLIRERLFTPGGHVQGLGSLAAAFSEEPFNLGLVNLLASGKLESLVEKWSAEEALDKSGDVTKRRNFRLLALLAHWCLVQPQLRGERKPASRERHAASPCCPVLADESNDLPLVSEYNRRVLAHAASRARFQLGLLPTSLDLEISTRENLIPSGLVAKALEAQKISGVIARDPRAAILGRGDEFDSVTDLVLATRRGDELLLDASVVPVIPEDRPGSYALDFLAHGKLSCLQSDNLLTATQSWKVIDEWRSFLWTLSRGLQKGGRDGKADTMAIASLYEEIKDKIITEGA